VSDENRLENIFEHSQEQVSSLLSRGSQYRFIAISRSSTISLNMRVGIQAGGDVAIFDFVKTDVQAFFYKKRK